MKVTVTDRNIQLASKRRQDGLMMARNCPIALALKRHTKKTVLVACGREAVIGGRRIVYLPEKAREFIRSFDKYVRVMPFTFEI